MKISSPLERVVVVVLDGLRPDAVDAFQLDNLRALSSRGAFTATATTVSPSVTAAAMASLFTGVPPMHHGLSSDRFHIPRPRVALDPLPALVARAGLPVSSFVRTVPLVFRPFARACASKLGIRSPVFVGDTAPQILDAARETLRTQRHGLIVVHWPDVDAAGHDHGWMSNEYGVACRVLDAALGDLVSAECVLDDPDTLLIALADHGGGGVSPRNHEEDHQLNLRIPLLLVGGRVVPGALRGDVSILDVAPTVAWALGIDAPVGWPGKALRVIAGDTAAVAHDDDSAMTVARRA
jgi:arylsulfatase A-like enzyme